jgi:hypothetical protein
MAIEALAPKMEVLRIDPNLSTPAPCAEKERSNAMEVHLIVGDAPVCNWTVHMKRAGRRVDLEMVMSEDSRAGLVRFFKISDYCTDGVADFFFLSSTSREAAPETSYSRFGKHCKFSCGDL